MSYIARVQRSIDYIESRLQDEISLLEVAKVAAFSPYHFHRIFSLIVGETLKSYIRKRRLTEAAYELRDTDGRIIDIALTYQFESQQSFSRAFKKQFFVTPAEYRKLSKFPRYYEKKQLTEDVIMHRNEGININTTIITLPTITVVGLEYRGSRQHEGKIPALWGQFSQRQHEVPHRDGKAVTYGVCYANKDMIQNDDMIYIAGVPVTQVGELPEGMVSWQAKGGKFVSVTHKGPISKIRETLDFIHGTWLPKSGYDPDDRSDLELYDERFKFDDPSSEFDLFVPIT